MRENNSSQPALEISLLGKFRARIDGVLIDEKRWTRRSAKSLVKLLALKPFHALHREQIMDLIWAEETPETACNNLNKAIHAARRAFEPDLAKGSHSRFVLTENNQVVLNSPGALVVDLDEFERLAEYALKNNDLEAGQKAVAIYRGDLLTEDVYEDWIYTRRESMRILYRKTATKIAGLYAAKVEHQAGIGILKKLAAEDSSDEYVHRLLMRFYIETGSKYQALKQFEQCRAALKTLGIEPEPETLQLEQKIKRGEILPVQNGPHLQNGNGHQPAPTIVAAPRITPLTFQNGVVRSAKFLPDGKTIIVSASWEDGVWQLFEMSPETNEFRPLGIEKAEVLAISAAGDIAVALNRADWFGFVNPATLAIVSPDGGAPRVILENVEWADWHPCKAARTSVPAERFLAVVRDRNGRNCLEFPIGSVIYETGGWISHPQFSADGKKIAFLEHPIPDDDEGFVVVVDLEENNRKRILTENWLTVSGLAWMNDEIWFTASQEAKTRTVNAVNLNGEERLIYRGLGRLRLRDVSRCGKILISDEKMRNHSVARQTANGVERDLSWHDFTIPRDLSDDGETILIEEGGLSVGNSYLAFVRKINGSAARMIGSGAPIALSPDNKFVLIRVPSPTNRLALINVETKEKITLETDSEQSLIYQEYAGFFPDGKRIIFAANRLDCGTQIYIQNGGGGGKPVCLTPHVEGVKMDWNKTISPDGNYVVLRNPDRQLSLYQIADGTSSPLKNLAKDFSVVRWTADGNRLFLRREREFPAVVYQYDLAAGTLEKHLEITPKDAAGVRQIAQLKLSPDGRTCVYSFKREFSDLYLMEDF